MNKVEIAGYLVNLHTLLEAQSKGQTSVPSSVLAAEYEKHWGLLKEAIAKENADDEARRSEHGRESRHKAGGVEYVNKSQIPRPDRDRSTQ